VISAELINLAGVPIDTLTLLKPVFEELEEIEEGINEQEFVDACDRLYNVSPYHFFIIYRIRFLTKTQGVYF
jgi:hypothetical protein